MMEQPAAAGGIPQQQPMGPPPYVPMMKPPSQLQPPPVWSHHHSFLHQTQPQQPVHPTSADEVRTLWIGDLQYWMDENYLLNCFSHTGEVVSVKVIRNKQTMKGEGYGFIEFTSRVAAERILMAYNGSIMPNGGQNFKLNWASFSGDEKRDETLDFTIFVGDLAADVNDNLLKETFKARFSSVKGAKVVIDRLTARTKGYGFVRFGNEGEQLRAMTEMNGVFCSTRPMRIGLAANKKDVSGQQYSKASYPNSQALEENNPNNTTIFVGNLDTQVTEDNLKELFGQYGQLVHVKILTGKRRCGFVEFAERSCAEEVLRALDGTQLSGQNIRLSWGRGPSNKQPQLDANLWNNGYYMCSHGYENYGYTPALQDPNVYYGGYPGYGNYQQQQVGYS